MRDANTCSGFILSPFLSGQLVYTWHLRMRPRSCCLNGVSTVYSLLLYLTFLWISEYLPVLDGHVKRHVIVLYQLEERLLWREVCIALDLRYTLQQVIFRRQLWQQHVWSIFDYSRASRVGCLCRRISWSTIARRMQTVHCEISCQSRGLLRVAFVPVPRG